MDSFERVMNDHNPTLSQSTTRTNSPSMSSCSVLSIYPPMKSIKRTRSQSPNTSPDHTPLNQTAFDLADQPHVVSEEMLIDPVAELNELVQFSELSNVATALVQTVVQTVKSINQSNIPPVDQGNDEADIESKEESTKPNSRTKKENAQSAFSNFQLDVHSNEQSFTQFSSQTSSRTNYQSSNQSNSQTNNQTHFQFGGSRNNQFTQPSTSQTINLSMNRSRSYNDHWSSSVKPTIIQSNNQSNQSNDRLAKLLASAMALSRTINQASSTLQKHTAEYQSINQSISQLANDAHHYTVYQSMNHHSNYQSQSNNQSFQSNSQSVDQANCRPTHQITCRSVEYLDAMLNQKVRSPTQSLNQTIKQSSNQFSETKENYPIV